MRSAPRDSRSQQGDVVLERTAAQTLWWFLGHWVFVAVFAAILAAGVIVASAIAAGSAPTSTTVPGSATYPATSTGPAEATLTITCSARAQLTVKASGDGFVELTIGGPISGHSTGPGIATATLSGPSGTYHVRVTATGRLDRMSWYSTAGLCSE